MTADLATAFTLFDLEIADRLEAGHITRLAAGVLASVRIRGFFTAQQCDAVMRGLELCEMGAYDERLVQPPVAKLGPAAYDHYSAGKLTDEYWAYAEHSEQNRAHLLHGTDPLAVAVARLREAWPGEVRAATSDGRPMFAGMVREINHGARMHFDEVVREFEGVMDELPISQLAFNCYLAMPEAGGESVVFRRRWQPGDEAHRDLYGYQQYLAAGEPACEVRAEVGDGVLFDPRNYHIVRPNVGQGRRVTLSFFVGISARGALHIWS